VDLGDLDAQPSNKEIASATRDVVRGAPMAVILGGDNAVTYPAMLGMAGDGIEGWGLVTLDAHHDVRTYEGRPGNGSPVRALIDAGLPGNQVVQVGIAGFSNSVAYRRWCDDVGIDVVTAAEVRFGTIEDVLVEAFDRLALSVDHIYVDLDIDVHDDDFAAELAGRAVEIVAEGPADVVVWAVDEPADLARLPSLIEWIHPAGALWAVWVKGRKELNENHVREAALDAGLVDVKV